jgi:uncharacterized protein
VNKLRYPPWAPGAGSEESSCSRAKTIAGVGSTRGRSPRVRGFSLSGMYLPGSLEDGEKRPAIIMAHGFSAVKENYLANFAEKLEGAGFVAPGFDYRLFGDSEGEPRGHLIPAEQHKDYRNAITWISQRPEVEPERIGIWGSSYSGGHVLYLASFDKRIKAAVSQAPLVNGWQKAQRLMRRTSSKDSSGRLPKTAPNATPEGRAPRYRWSLREENPQHCRLPNPTSGSLTRETPSPLTGATSSHWRAWRRSWSTTQRGTYTWSRPPLLIIVAEKDTLTPTEWRSWPTSGLCSLRNRSS